jgi:uncharacterized membrane protein
MRSRVLLPVAALLAASGWCVLLLAARSHAYGPAGYRILVWNLALAWIPLLFALLLHAAYKRRAHWLGLVAVAAGWLLFLPNAPYMLTDFVHLGAQHRLIDSLILGSFAFTALALGFASLLLVQLVTTRAAGRIAGWLVVVGSMFAASIGIYLGRVQRLNSWDVLHRPRLVLAVARSGLEDPFGHRYLIGFVLAFCGFLTLVYAGLYGFTSLVAAVGREDR